MAAGAVEHSPTLSYSSYSGSMTVPDVEYIVPPPGSVGSYQESHASTVSSSSAATPRSFKKHRPLPRTRNGSANGSLTGTPDSRTSSSGSRYVHHPNPQPLSNFVLSENGSGSHVASLHTLRHQRRKISGGELPPTPPAHSRTSSSSHSVNLPNLTPPLQTPAQSSEDVQSKTSPSTPPNQRSPPTPDVTPPQSETRATAAAPSSRPTLAHRIPSKSTTADSRTESFRTALESPEISEEEEDSNSTSNPTLRPVPQSARTSQITVREIVGGERKLPNGVGLGLGVESDTTEEPNDLTPKSKGDFTSFDGEWGAVSEVEQEWDDNLSRNVTVRKRRDRTHVNGQRHEVVDDKPVTPTNATNAVRALPLQGRILTYDAEARPRSFTAPEPVPAPTEAPTNRDSRRLSVMSAKSAASTVVGAILVETPPRQRKTLRHVKRVDSLRNSGWQPSSSPLSSVPSLHENASQQKRVSQARGSTRESYASTSTNNSVSSRKARRDVWKNGGIPVVVVPDRQSSNRSSSQERSLRSTSSQKSRRSHSITSVPPQAPNHQDLASYLERPSRRGRRTSESDGSIPGDQRTIDIPPVVPRRTSSLSASTSRNGSREPSRHGSRAGSLTAESLQAHNDSTLAKSAAEPSSSREVAGPTSNRDETSVPVVTLNSTPSYDQFEPGQSSIDADDHHRRTVDTLFGSPHLSTQPTPFSDISEETHATAAEISHAMAVSIVPHQNRSVLMVDHRPSDSSDGERISQGPGRTDRAIVTTTEVNETESSATLPDDFAIHPQEEEPVTPQTWHPGSVENLDSPLRHPRAPPEPPVLRFIAATPSGLTPAEERPRLLGNFYEPEPEPEPYEEPPRGLAMLRKLTKRRNSYGPSPSRPGFLARRLSLIRNAQDDTAEDPELDQDDHATYDDEPRDESRLHPDWRPSYYPGYFGDEDDEVYDMGDEELGEPIRYPPIDNRPRPPKRSLSQRMKRTFAIMPLQDYDEYTQDDGTDRRTIRRTPSGNLRVVKHRGSVGSMRTKKQHKNRPDTAPETPRRGPIFPRSYSWTRKSRRGSRDSDTDSQGSGLRRTWSLTQSVGGIPRRISEKRREKRSNELRQKISGPLNVRDGVDDVIRRDGNPRRAEPGRVPGEEGVRRDDAPGRPDDVRRVDTARRHVDNYEAWRRQRSS